MVMSYLYSLKLLLLIQPCYKVSLAIFFFWIIIKKTRISCFYFIFSIDRIYELWSIFSSKNGPFGVWSKYFDRFEVTILWVCTKNGVILVLVEIKYQSIRSDSLRSVTDQDGFHEIFLSSLQYWKNFQVN